jgi:hypothetical protein
MKAKSIGLVVQSADPAELCSSASMSYNIIGIVATVSPPNQW